MFAPHGAFVLPCPQSMRRQRGVVWPVSQGTVPTGWHSSRRDDGRTGHDGEAAADPRSDPRVYVGTGLPAIGARDRRTRRALVVVDRAIAPQDARAARAAA